MFISDKASYYSTMAPPAAAKRRKIVDLGENQVQKQFEKGSTVSLLPRHQLDVLKLLHRYSKHFLLSKSILDCTIVLEENKQIKMPSALLRSISPLFRMIWQHGICCSCDEKLVILPSVRMTIFVRFLSLLYSGSCNSEKVEEKHEIECLLKMLGIAWSLCYDNIHEESCDDVADGVGHTVIGGCYDDEVDEVDDNIHEESCDDVNDEVGHTVIGGCYDDEVDEVAVADVSNQRVLKPSIFEENLTSNPVYFHCEAEKINPCSRLCSYDCSQVLKTWTPDAIRKMGSKFQGGKGSQETKRKLLRHLRSQFNIGVPTDTYTVHDQSFCLKFFSGLTNISEFKLNSVLKDFWNGITQYSHGNKGKIKQLSLATTTFICWLKQFSESYGQFSPETNTTILSYWLNKQFLFQLYLKGTCGPHLSQSAFYENFKIHFSYNRSNKTLPNVIISKYSSHSICNQCVALNNNRRQAKTETELQVAKDLENQHKQVFGEARRAIQEIKQSAVTFPSDNLFMQVNYLYFYRLFFYK